jgi:hypothetical protein
MAGVDSAEVRHIAVDAHKHYGVFLGVNPQLEVVLPGRRVDWTRLEAWMKQHLKPTDIVVIEATTNTWHLFDLIKPYVAHIKIANAGRVKLLGAGGVKTDNRDAFHLARTCPPYGGCQQQISCPRCGFLPPRFVSYDN